MDGPWTLPWGSDDVDDNVKLASAKYDLPESLLRAVVDQESGGNPDAVSPKGARGPMQLMPATARDLGVDPDNVAQNIDGGARYLRAQMDRFGNVDDALAAYNAGPGRVASGGPLPSETQNYVRSINAKMDAAPPWEMDWKQQDTPPWEMDWSTPSVQKPEDLPADGLTPAQKALRDFGMQQAFDVASSASVPAENPQQRVQQPSDLPADGLPPEAKALRDFGMQQAFDVGSAASQPAPQQATETPQFSALTDAGLTADENGNIESPINPVGEFAKGFAGYSNKVAANLNLALSVAPIIADNIASVATHSNTTQFQDWWFGNMVKPLADQQSQFSPDASASIIDRMSNSFGNLTGMLASIMASTPVAAEMAPAELANLTASKIVGNAVDQGARAAIMPGLTDAASTMQDVYQSTGDVQKAAAAGAATYLTTALQFMVPVSAEGNLAERAATGAVGQAASQQAGRVMLNAVLPENMQQPFDIGQLGESLATGALMGGMMGHRASEPTPGRSLLGYEDTQPSPDILRADNLDDAIAAANAQINAPVRNANVRVNADNLEVPPTPEYGGNAAPNDAGLGLPRGLPAESAGSSPGPENPGLDLRGNENVGGDNALPIGRAATLDVRQQAGNGEAMGGGNAELPEATSVRPEGADLGSDQARFVDQLAQDRASLFDQAFNPQARETASQEASAPKTTLEARLQDPAFRDEIASWEPRPQDLAQDGLAQRDSFDAALVRKAADIDPTRVDALGVQYANDGAGFMRAIGEIVNEDASAKADRASQAPQVTGTEAAEGAAPAGETPTALTKDAAIQRYAQIVDRIRAATPEESRPLMPQAEAARQDAISAGASQLDLVRALEAPRRPIAPQRLAQMLERAQENKTPPEGGVSASGTAFARAKEGEVLKGPLTHEAQENLGRQIVSSWVNGPDFKAIRSMDEAPKAVQAMDRAQLAQGASGKPYAFLHDGTIYVITSEVHSLKDLVRGVFHEGLGHYGLRGKFGPELDNILAQVAAGRRADIMDVAQRYGFDVGKRAERLAAAEEVLAELAQHRPQLGVVQRAVSAVRGWLRNRGLDLKWTDNDIIHSFIIPARNWVERGGPRYDVTASKFARAANPADQQVEQSTEQKGDRLFGAARDAMSKMLEDLQLKVTPMAAGSDRARAIAKDYANAERASRQDWARMDEEINKRFSPAERKLMWQAADEENVLRMTGQKSDTLGLSRLNPEQRQLVEALHNMANTLLQRAKDVGLYKGEGLPFWTPRVIAQIGKDGQFLGKPGEGKGVGGFSSPTGRNITATSPNLKGRKYLTAEETEAAAKAKFGDAAQVVRDIRTMPMAMARLERAIAGRALVNQIKAIGQRTGQDLVSEGSKPEGGYFTLDHPAFTTYRPRFVEQDGKYVAAVDQNGKMIFDRAPIYVSKEFEGPLKAIMSDTPGKIYSGFMALKAKTMGVIMYSPLIHNAVEWGRALPMMPGKVLTFRIYFEGNRAKHDPATMREFIDAGMVPIGHRFQNQDISGIIEEPNIQPGRSLTAKALSYPVSLVSKEGADMVRRGIDKAGDVWHNKLLWDRVADLQAGLAVNLRDLAMAKGIDRQTATRIAAHLANRYAGALPNEAMSVWSRKIANFTLFSRTFTIGNLGVMKDMLTGLPRDVKAQILRDSGKLVHDAATSFARRKAIHAFMLDVAMFYATNALLQSGLDYLRRDKSLSQIEQGYVDRLHKLAKRVKDSPLQLVNVFSNIESLMPNAENEPGKENRIRFGQEPNGTAIYLRTPVGKIGEEFVGWMSSPIDMLTKKLGTVARPIFQTVANDRGFGRPVYDKDAKGISGAVKNVGSVVKLFLEQQVPVDSIKAGYDMLRGKADQTSEMKALGSLFGVTFSKGAPGGPAVGEMFAMERKHHEDVQAVMPDVREALKDGDRQKAVTIMQGANMNLNEIRSVLRREENPASRLTPRRLQQFNRTADEESKAKMERFLNER